jgi:hypothetical protein
VLAEEIIPINDGAALMQDSGGKTSTTFLGPLCSALTYSALLDGNLCDRQ